MYPGFNSLVGLADGGLDSKPTLLCVLIDLYVQKASHTSEEERQFIELALRLIDVVDAATRAEAARRATRASGPNGKMPCTHSQTPVAGPPSDPLPMRQCERARTGGGLRIRRGSFASGTVQPHRERRRGAGGDAAVFHFTKPMSRPTTTAKSATPSTRAAVRIIWVKIRGAISG